MKKIVVIAAGVFILAACSNEEKTAGSVKYSDLTSEGLKGKITAIEEAPYKTDSTGKAGEMDSCCTDKWQYDENGNYIGSTSKDSKGGLKSESVAERYPDGLWKGEKTTRDGKKTAIETKIDDKGNWVSAQAWDSSGNMDVYYTNITQTESGQVKSWKEYRNKDSAFTQEWESTFDKNLQTGYTMKDSVGKIKSSGSFKYNDKGERTEESNTNVTKDSTTTTVTKYSYETHDDQGNWTQRTTWNDKGKATRVTKRTYTYAAKEAEKK